MIQEGQSTAKKTASNKQVTRFDSIRNDFLTGEAIERPPFEEVKVLNSCRE